MQPETKAKTKDNLEASRENKKNISSEREYTAAEQWDHVAFKLIRDILAPDGFKKITAGHHRGSIIAKSKSPGIEKLQVTYCQKGAAQLVRSYRSMTLKKLKDRLALCEKYQQESINFRDNYSFWQFRKKRMAREKYEHYRDQSGLLEVLIHEIEQIGIK